MSENSSSTVDQPLPRNDDQPIQNGIIGREGQVIPLANMRPLSPPIARRTLVIENHSDIVSVLSSVSRNTRQAIYILSGRGHVSQVTLLSVPSRQLRIGTGLGQILYLSGWFSPMITNLGVVATPSSRANGVLHVSLTGGSQTVAIAITLIALGPFEVDVIFVCGPGSVFQPDAPGGPREPIRVRANEIPAPQAPLAE